MLGWDPQGRYVFVTVPRWKLWEMQCDGWMPFKRLFPQERGGLSCAHVLDCWVSDTQSHTAWFFTRGAVVEPLQQKECVRSWELLAAMKKEKTRLCLNVLMQRGTCLWREGSHSAEWTLYRGKGRRHSKAIIYHHRGQIATSVRACLHVIPSAYNQCLSVFPTIPYNLVGLSSFFLSCC